MSHFAMTQDEVQVCDWTGDVPRVGETVHLNPVRPGAAAGVWKVASVEWALSTGVEAPARAEVTIEPVDEVAKVWLNAARWERAHAQAGEAG